MLMLMTMLMVMLMTMLMMVTWKPVAEVISGQRPWIAVSMEADTSKEGRTCVEEVIFLIIILVIIIIKKIIISAAGCEGRLTWWKLYSVAARERKVDAWLCTIDKTCNRDVDHHDDDDGHNNDDNDDNNHNDEDGPPGRIGGVPFEPSAKPTVAPRLGRPAPI